jgi:hypothetical protein
MNSTKFLPASEIERRFFRLPLFEAAQRSSRTEYAPPRTVGDSTTLAWSFPSSGVAECGMQCCPGERYQPEQFRGRTVPLLPEPDADWQFFSSPFLVTRIHDRVVEARFRSLADTWKQATSHLSNIKRKSMHPAYQEIIGMGMAVVESVLCDLKQSHADWFWALTAITGDNPIPEDARGDVAQMTEAWLKWGRAKGYSV